MKKGRSLNVLKNRPLNSALSSATENNPNAELGIRVIVPCRELCRVGRGKPQYIEGS